MEKLIRNGEVAILYSPSFGAGWYTWNTEYPEIIYHPEIVKLVEEDRRDEITESFIKSIIPRVESMYCGGAGELQIMWLEQGTQFTIEEYDGNESVKLIQDLSMTA